MPLLPDMLAKVLKLHPEERQAALWSGFLFYLLLTGYYILRPLREEMGLAGGVYNLPYLYLGTLSVMALATPAFGQLVRRQRRDTFLPLVYRFVAASLAVFYLVFRSAGDEMLLPAGRAFYVWVSVLNMFLVSLFWAFMSDGFGYERSRRLFGFIAVGGTLGAILGSALTSLLVDAIGPANLLLLSIVCLEIAARVIRPLSRRFRQAAFRRNEGPPVAVSRAPGEGALAGISLTASSPYLLGVSAYLFLYSLSSTFLYFEQAHIIAALDLSREAKASIFARIDLWTNVLTLIGQLFLTGRLLGKLGTGLVLALLPLATAMGFAALGTAPILPVLVVFQVARRAGNYALARPARETLFTTVDDNVRYKAKSFIDTFVYRGGDALGAGGFNLLTRLGLGLSGIAWLAVPAALVWGVCGLFLGRRQRRQLRTIQRGASQTTDN